VGAQPPLVDDDDVAVGRQRQHDDRRRLVDVVEPVRLAVREAHLVPAHVEAGAGVVDVAVERLPREVGGIVHGSQSSLGA